MIEKKEINSKKQTVITNTFKSLSELDRYLKENNNSKLFGTHKSSESGSSHFTGTMNFEQARDYMVHGEKASIEKLQKQIKLENKVLSTKTTKKMEYNVVGFQASVPRYLQGLPTSMVNQRKVVQKQKIINVVKNIGYLANVSKEQIVKESTKAIMLIKKIEDKGYRVNLDVAWVSVKNNKEVYSMITRIKSSTEKLNVSKLAFPLVNPSMLRRIGFRTMEYNKLLTEPWYFGYGQSITDTYTLKSIIPQFKDSYIVPSFISDIDEVISSWGLK